MVGAVDRLVAKLHERAKADPVMRQDAAEFLAPGVFALVDGEVRATVGLRHAVIEDDAVVFSHDSWPETKRVPL